MWYSSSTIVRISIIVVLSPFLHRYINNLQLLFQLSQIIGGIRFVCLDNVIRVVITLLWGTRRRSRNARATRGLRLSS